MFFCNCSNQFTLTNKNMTLLNLRNEVVKSADFVVQYKAIETALFGGMHPQAAQLWGYLLAIQSSANICGDLMEIGVFKGWGSYLPARHCRSNEKIVLVDIAQHHLDLATTFLTEQAQVQKDVIEQLLIDSAAGAGLTGLLGANRCFRWIHIDGEHSYNAVMQDLDSAALFASTEAVICVDDVDHSLAPGINDALIDWLARNKHWKLLVRGYNKAYIVSVRSKVAWSHYINFLPEVFKRFFSSNILLASQTQSSDTNYFSYGDPFDDKSYLKVNQTVLQIEDFEGANPRSFLLGESRKPTILVFGNCQMNVLHGALVAASSLCGLDIRFEYVKDVHEATSEDAERLKSLACKADGIICQKVSGDKFAIRTDQLLDCLPNGLIITVPSMHFNAYWPNHADLQMTSGSPHCMPVDALIYNSIQTGLSNTDIKNLLNNPELFTPSDISIWFSEAVERLRQREVSDCLTIRLSNFLQVEAVKERCFYIFNHPKKKVFDYTLRLLLKEIGKTFEPRYPSFYGQIIGGEIDVQFDMSMIDFVDIPPLISVSSFLGMSVEDSINGVYRYVRPRGSREIHSRLIMEDELRFVRERFVTLSDDQKKFNREIISASTLIEKINLG